MQIKMAMTRGGDAAAVEASEHLLGPPPTRGGDGSSLGMVMASTGVAVLGSFAFGVAVSLLSYSSILLEKQFLYVIGAAADWLLGTN